jgi:Protein of unknown function (DUF3553)
MRRYFHNRLHFQSRILIAPSNLMRRIEGDMEYRRGMWVRNPKQAAWGLGEIIALDGDKVTVLFNEVGEKKVVTRIVSLEEVPAPAHVAGARPQLSASLDVNMLELERLCHAFHDQFKDRRSNTDDGIMALQVLDDMRKYGELSKKIARKLFSWCHTGASFAEGVDLAQQICRLIYRRVPTRAEIDGAGFS